MDMPSVCFSAMGDMIRCGFNDLAQQARQAWGDRRHCPIPTGLPKRLTQRIARADRMAVRTPPTAYSAED